MVGGSRGGDDVTFSDSDFAGAFAPRAVTVVGASATSYPTQYLIQNLLVKEECRFAGPLYLINRSRPVIQGIQAFESTADIEGEPGLVIVLIPTEQSVAALNGFKRRPQGVVVFGLGAEAGEVDAQRKLVAWSNQNGVPLFGPQSVGFASPATRTVALSAPLPEPVRVGGVALVMQSGALITSCMRALLQRDVGIHTAVAVGTSAAVGYDTVGEYLLQLPDVRVLGMYIENIRDPDRIIELGRLGMELGKPVIVVLGGSSEAGRVLARSHSGALATDRRVFEGITRQFGIVLVTDTDELVWSIEVLAKTSYQIGQRGGVAIFSRSGGGAVVMADALTSAGVPLPSPGRETQTKLSAGQSVTSFNPFDWGAMHPRPELDSVLSTYAADPAFSILVYCAAVGFVAPDFIAGERESMLQFVRTAYSHGKFPMIAVPAAQGVTVRVASEVQWPGVPMAFGVKEAASKLRTLWLWSNRPEPVNIQLRGPEAPIEVLAAEATAEILSGPVAREILEALHVEWPREVVVSSADEADLAWANFTFPVVAKAEAGLAHRALVGGVLGHIKNKESLRAATEFLLAAFGGRVSIAEEVQHKHEYVLGYHYDTRYGPLIMFGVGGTNVGSEVAFRRIPLGNPETTRLVTQYVTEVPMVEQVVKTVQALEALALRSRWIRSVDLNPLVVGPRDTIVVLDAKVHCTAEREQGATQSSRAPHPVVTSSSSPSTPQPGGHDRAAPRRGNRRTAP